MLFSYDYIALKLNEHGVQKIQQIESGKDDFVRDPMSIKDVVRSFQQHWQQGNSYIKAINSQPEISINLAGFKVIPDIHRVLQISFLGALTPKGHVSIEFSHQEKQLFYHSQQIPIDEIVKGLDLSKHDWIHSQKVGGKLQKTTSSWSDLQTLDALVLRFYGISEGDIKLAQLALKQTAELALPEHRRPCVGEGMIPSCWLTNLMNHHNMQTIEVQGYSDIEYAGLSEISPFLWLVASWLTAMFVLRLGKLDLIKVYVWVSAVFLAIFLMHQDWMGFLSDQMIWPLVLVMLGLVWSERRHFLKPKNVAINLWLGSVVLFLLMQGINPGFEFIVTLPTYFLWALLQQLMIGPLFSDMIYQEGRVSKGSVACFVGVLFSVIHAPNHVLMIATLIGGFCWSYAWLTYKNIYANAFSHALLALMFYQVMPEAWLGSARIGIFF